MSKQTKQTIFSVLAYWLIASPAIVALALIAVTWGNLL
jgi:hypothetical protein